MKNIVLIGFMGSGKTTLGKWISQNKNMDFIDTDEYIEDKEKMKISDIFKIHGEEYFRNLETDAIKELSGKLKNTVISVGGGLPVREKNRLELKKTGEVIYLKTSIDELEKRLSGDTKRPLLEGGSIRKKIESLMNDREDLYLDAATKIIATDNKSFEEIYREIVE